MLFCAKQFEQSRLRIVRKIIKDQPSKVEKRLSDSNHKIVYIFVFIGFAIINFCAAAFSAIQQFRAGISKVRKTVGSMQASILASKTDERDIAEERRYQDALHYDRYEFGPDVDSPVLFV